MHTPPDLLRGDGRLDRHAGQDLRFRRHGHIHRRRECLATNRQIDRDGISPGRDGRSRGRQARRGDGQRLRGGRGVRPDRRGIGRRGGQHGVAVLIQILDREGQGVADRDSGCHVRMLHWMKENRYPVDGQDDVPVVTGMAPRTPVDVRPVAAHRR